jgi:hypothetical protein
MASFVLKEAKAKEGKSFTTKIQLSHAQVKSILAVAYTQHTSWECTGVDGDGDFINEAVSHPETHKQKCAEVLYLMTLPVGSEVTVDSKYGSRGATGSTHFSHGKTTLLTYRDESCGHILTSLVYDFLHAKSFGQFKHKMKEIGYWK